MNSPIAKVNDVNFESEVLQARLPVLVICGAEWCGPCQRIAPIMHDLAQEYAGRIRVATLDIDDSSLIPPRYHVRSIPTLMIFKDGSVVATQAGQFSKWQLKAFINAHVEDSRPRHLMNDWSVCDV
jgi:thioredoxin 1